MKLTPGQQDEVLRDWESRHREAREAHGGSPEPLEVRAAGPDWAVPESPGAREGKCESVQERTGLPCPARALWIVAVGTRKMDEQAACGGHLNRACTALEGAENRDNVTLTVRRAPA